MARRSAADAEETRASILEAARVKFARVGYRGASTAEIAAEIDLTEGAIFHHFRSKKGLFRAVFEQLEKELDDHAHSHSRSGTPAERFLSGCRAYLEFVCREDYSRIALVEAPSVLGKEVWHDVDAGMGLKTVQRAVENLIRAGVIAPQPVKPLAVLLYGALNESSFALARREQGVTVDTQMSVLERILPRL